MSPTWSFRFFGTVIATVLSIILLLPTFLGVKEMRADLKAKGQELPWYLKVLPDDELNLGLDLRGGLYVELDVGLADAQSQELNILASDLKRYFLKGELAKNEVHNVGGAYLRVEVPADQAKSVKNEIASYMKSRYGEGSFKFANSASELFLAVKSVNAGEVRKKVAAAVADVPGYAEEITTSHGKKYVVLPYKDDAEKEALTQALSKPEVSSLVEVKAVADVFYVSLQDAFFAGLKRTLVEQAANAVRNRIDRFGLAEASVSRQGSDRLVVEVPGTPGGEAGTTDIISLIQRTGNLEFRLVDKTLDETDLERLIAEKAMNLKIETPYEGESLAKINTALKPELPENTEILYELRRDERTKKVVQASPYLLSKEAQVTGKMLDIAKVEYDTKPYVSMRFNKIGAKAFGDLTSANVGSMLAIVLDDVVMSAPVIRSAITGGEARIDLNDYSDDVEKEARELVLILREGALPAKLTLASKNVIGPSLGQESIDSGLNSVLISSVAVILFMLLYYRLSGVVANVALILNVAFLFAILCLFQASVTLPGLAGIALTIGMAVDANVIIFERMREEKYLGHAIHEVVESGYSNAMSAIIDGNITTFIAGVVLFQYGTGPIKGFATTLMIGIVTTMFSAIIVTKVVFEWLVNAKKVKALGI